MHPSTEDIVLGGCARLRAFFLAVLSLTSVVLTDRVAFGQEAKDDGRSELILTNLPSRRSKAYKNLRGLAGKEANGQVLGFTQSEMWSMPSSRIEGVIRQGEALGVKMTRTQR